MGESSSEAKGKYIVTCNTEFGLTEISYSKQVSRLVWGETVVQLRTKPPCWVIALEATFHEKWSWNSVAYTKKT